MTAIRPAISCAVQPKWVLQRFAQVAHDELRTTDLLCRWGGEEFLVLFPDTTADQAFSGLQRLHDRVRNEVFDALGPRHHKPSSAGLTPLVPNESLETATERADQAMYRAKSCGRDQTALAPVCVGEALNQTAEPTQSKAEALAGSSNRRRTDSRATFTAR